MKTVFPSAELYHVWAHQSQSYGRASGQSVYFQDEVIYSYGSHFPMAKIIKKRGKPVAVLVTTRRYSVTTSGHLSATRSAVSHLPAYYVFDPTEKNGDILDRFQNDIERLAKEYANGKRHSPKKLAELDSEISEANRYAEFAGSKRKFARPAWLVVGSEKFAEQSERLRVAREKKEAADNAKRIKLAKELVAEFEFQSKQWKAGKRVEFPQGSFNAHKVLGLPVPNEMLRIRGKGKIQTSKGVILPLDEVKPIVGMIRGEHSGRTELQLDRWGTVHIDREKATVSVGCHTVDFAECERIANIVGM